MRILYAGVFQKKMLRKITLAAVAVAALAVASPLQAQSKLADKANELYKNNQFSAAATLYSQALQEMENEGKQGRNTTLLKSKLAYCYRMNNKMDKAEVLYAEVVKADDAKAENFYYYGEALMSNGKYAEAKKWFADYQKLEPTEEKAALMLRACDYAPLIEPYFQNVDIQEFAHNSEADDNAPILNHKGLIFSSDRQVGGIKILKEKSGWTGRDYLNLYISEKKSDGSFAEPIQYSSKLSEVNKNTGNASLTADGSEIFFTRNDNVLNKQNTYSLQLFSAKSGDTERWKNVEKLPFCSSNHNFMHPAVSPDGSQLFFASNRAGGFGGTDLWVSERKNGEWGKPENLGPAVNTTVNEGFPFVALDGKLFFCSKGHPGFGGFDIFVTYKDENGAWQPATNLGKPINSPLDDISIFISPDQRSGFFTSSRSGGDDDIFSFHVLDGTPAAPAVVAAPVVEEAPPAPVMEKEVAQSQTKVAEVQPEPVLEKPEVEIKMPEKPAPQPAPVEVVAAPKIEEPVAVPAEKPVLPKAEKIEEKPVRNEVAGLPKTAPAPPTEGVKTPAVADVSVLNPFVDLGIKLDEGSAAIGERFRLDGATFDPKVWQLTPRITAPLDKLVSQMKIHPSLQIEISAHTEALGVDEENLRLSEDRANTVLDYLVREGIAKGRIMAKGCGETMPLNHCRNGTTCSMDEHLLNQRIEVKVLALDGKL
ncbi:MAG: OmpA family protein [Saprospiraceae bacterium]|nr:OmpA family protein [Saprospiraceae bacterium]